MEKDDEKEGPEKGFVVRDKRFGAQKEGGEPSRAAKEERKPEEPPREDLSDQSTPLPEINFVNFILSLSTSALIQLGVIQDPITKESAKHLPMAKQTIDLIGMLREKTKGNLTPDEERLMENVLYDLRMRYVKEAE